MKISISNPEAVSIATEFLKRGAIIVFPTDTSYGLGTSGLKSNENNIRKIYEIKERSFDKPLSLLITKDMITKFLSIPIQFQEILNRIWPERLTVITRFNSFGLDTLSPLLNQKEPEKIAIRVPKHELLLNIIEKAGCPIIGTSANKSGSSSKYDIDSIIKEFSSEQIDLYIDGGHLPKNPPSTILDITNPDIPVIIRKGQVEIEEIFKNV